MVLTLDHIEKTLSDAYRKEIDQEENVWRTLPFFAAIISFELAGLTQVFAKMKEYKCGLWWDATSSMAIIALLVILALIFMAASIAPAKFVYISSEPEMLKFARDLDGDERNDIAASPPNGTGFNAAFALKEALAEQYSVATHHNRQINQRRAWYRSLAGLAILGSVAFTMFLVARLMLHYIPNGVATPGC